MAYIVLLRHGQSEWNKLNKFTGWTDVELSERGREEAREAGSDLRKRELKFDRVYTSYLKRAIHTAYEVLDTLDMAWLPVVKTWRLNERHYGALQGLNKADTAAMYGDAQVHEWRRSFAVRPPLLENIPADVPLWYEQISSDMIPRGESLEDTVYRVVPYAEEHIFPEVSNGKNILVVAHGNSLRAMIKDMENLSDEEVVGLELETGVPRLYSYENGIYTRI